jgi:hypothetical protein
MLDHDQRFKTLIREFFRDFLALFFADWERRLDCDAAEWLDKEVFPDPPEGPRRILDLVAKVPTREVVPGKRPVKPAAGSRSSMSKLNRRTGQRRCARGCFGRT